MNFVIITHVAHILEQNHYFAYAPYVREMNIWIKQVESVIIVAPESKSKKTPIDLKYEHGKIEFVAVNEFDVLNLKGILSTVFKVPGICWRIFSAMRKSDHIHLRCPGNMGVLSRFYFQIKLKQLNMRAIGIPNQVSHLVINCKNGFCRILF